MKLTATCSPFGPGLGSGSGSGSGRCLLVAWPLSRGAELRPIILASDSIVGPDLVQFDLVQFFVEVVVVVAAGEVRGASWKQLKGRSGAASSSGSLSKL